MNHYQPVQKAHTHHATTGNYSRYQTGKLVGEYRDIPAVIIDEAGFDGLGVQTQVGGADDAWCLVNVFDHLHRYVESVAINGAIDADHAVCVALGQFDHLETAYGKIVSAQDASFDQMHWSSTAIYRVLSDDRQNAHYLPIINHKQLYDAATRITGLSVQWDGINPVSHGNIGQLLLDMQKHDTYHEMVQTFDLAQALSDAQPMELDAFDALVESYNRLDLFKERLFRAMAKTPQDDIRVVNVTLTKPFKRQGVANIAMVFELSDGQHISIWFHNPDANPNKLGATDIMASWKWLLNRRDVTAALSPPNGANVQLPMLAHRMMRLAAKNSKRFIAAQKRKQVNQAKLAAAQSLVDERLAKLSEQDEEIERLSQQLASLTPTQVPQTIAKEVMVDVDAEVVGAASDDPDERLHAKPEQAVIHNPQQMAQKAVQDETDEPVVLTGDELGEFDLTTEAGKKSLRNAAVSYLNSLADEGDTIYCADLQADVKFGRKNNRKFGSLSGSEVKLFMAGQIKNIIARAKKFKPSQDRYDTTKQKNKMTYHYLKTAVMYQDKEYGARIVIREDSNGNYHYDLQVNSGGAEAIFDGIDTEKAELLLATNQGLFGFDNDSSNFNNPSQEFFEDDDAMLDSLKSGYVLNLFIFDEHGNEITDDEPVGETYSSDNPHAEYANDDALIKQNADNWENRLPRLTGDKVAEYNAKANPLGYVGDNEPRHASVGLYNLEKWVDVGDRRYAVKIDGKFKNFTSDESWDKPTDFEVYAEIIENGESNAWRDADDEQYYKATNDFDEALAQAEHWLKMAKQFELNQDEPTDEPVVLTGKELGEFDLTTEAGKKSLRETVADYLDGLRGKTVFCKALNADVEIRKKGIKKYLSTSSNPIKLQIAGALLDIIKNGKVFKPNVGSYAGKEQSHGVKYHYLKTPFVIDGVEYGARVVVREDDNGKFHYDLQVRNSVDVILDGVNPIKNPSVPNFHKALAVSDLSSIVYENDDACQVADKNSPEEFPLTHSGLVQGYESHVSANDAKSQDVFDKLNDLTSNMVLNLFIFDEHGNEITDDIADNNSATKKITKGRKNSVKTAKGTKVDTVFALVDSKYVISSHTESGNENPKYDQSLQPRDRGRENSIAWVIKTANNLDPESLGRTGRADTGAPIVGDDMMVESGNGRTMAIKLAYKNGKADDYVAWLKENADLFGFTEAQVEKYKQPILVRIRTSEIDRATFAIEANQDDKLSLSATERARADAKRLSDGMMENFNPSDDGDILAASNRKFIQDFLAMLGDAEASQYTDSNGNPTQALMARIKACVFAKAYDDDRLLEMMADVTNPELQNMLNALSKTAPQFIKARVTAQRDTQELSEKLVDGIELAIDQRLKNALVDATNLILAAKRSNQALAQYVKQQNLFGDIDPDVIELALFIAQNARSAKKMAEYFGVMAKYITQDNIKRQNLDMFGEPELLNLKEVMAYANNELGLSSQPTQNELTSEMQENKMNKSMNPNYTQDDIDYLNSIVNGSTNPLEVDFDRLIAIGEKDDTDPLFEQANDVISQALDQATQGE